MPAAVVLLFFSIFFVCVLKIITIINKQNKTKNEEKEGVWRRCSHVLHLFSFYFFVIFVFYFNNNIIIVKNKIKLIINDNNDRKKKK